MATFSDEQLARLFARLQPQPQPAPVVKLSSKVNWGEMKNFDTADPEAVDEWFVQFEGKMVAFGVSEDDYIGKFAECTKISEATKTTLLDRVRQSVHGKLASSSEMVTYAAVRLEALALYGPRHPVGHWRHALDLVRGNSREFVRSELHRVLNLLNRAARDAGKPEWDDWDLIHPFIYAFPAADQVALRKHLGFAMKLDDPLSHLFDHAPEVSRSETALLAALESSEGDVLARRKRPGGSDAALVAAVRAEVRKAIGGRPLCPRCGRDCLSEAMCPAAQAECYNCRRIGHFAQQCRDAGNRPPNPRAVRNGHGRGPTTGPMPSNTNF